MDPEEMRQLELDKVCRCCLTVKKEMRPLFGERIADMLVECASIQVDCTDGWPDKICMQCVQQISRFHSFKKKVEKLDQQLRDYIKGLTVIVEEQVQVQVPTEIAVAKLDLATGQQFLANGHHQVLNGGSILATTTAFGQPVQLQSSGGQLIPVHMLNNATTTGGQMVQIQQQQHQQHGMGQEDQQMHQHGIVPSLTSGGVQGGVGATLVHDNSSAQYYGEEICK